MVPIRRKLGDRFSYLGGLPTAEVYAAAYKALGTPVYSSAVFNFIPKLAMDFYDAIRTDDHATTNRLIDDFFLPYLAIRNKKAGYAVSIVKAGATPGRPRRRPGARAADRPDRGRIRTAQRADQIPRPAVSRRHYAGAPGDFASAPSSILQQENYVDHRLHAPCWSAPARSWRLGAFSHRPGDATIRSGRPSAWPPKTM